MRTILRNPELLLRLLISLLIISFTFWALGQSKEKATSKVEKPNVVFFLVDDMGWRDVGYAGSEFYETPNIDALAGQAMKFSNAYAAHPRCVPSRYAMITGRYPARIGSPGQGEGKLQNKEITMAEAFKEAGYSTFFAGKWHLASDESYPHTQGFDFNFGGGHAGAPKSYFQPYNKQTSNGNGHEKDIENLDDAPDGYYLTDHLTDKTVSFIQNQNQPFFVYLSHYGVHTPFEGKEEKVKAYRKKARQLYGDNAEEQFAFEQTTGDTKLQQDNEVYAAMVESIDESLQRVIAALKKKGVYENTIIVFTSDHGGLSNRGNNRKLATSNLPLRAGKGHNYEGGVRIPMFVAWANEIKEGTTNMYITGTDYYPTLLELAGLPLNEKQHLDGVSFAKAAMGKEQNTYDRPIFWHSPQARPASTGDYPNTAVRLGSYKLLDFYEEKRVELYDLSQDEGEQNNLASTMPEKRDELLALIKDWRKEVNAYIEDPAKSKKGKMKQPKK